MTIRIPRAMSLGVVVLSACGGMAPGATVPGMPSPTAAETRGTAYHAESAPTSADLPAASLLVEPPASPPEPADAPEPAQPPVDLTRPPLATDVEGAVVRNQALSTGGPRIVVSRGDRHLWVMDGERVVFSAPVAVGREAVFRYRDREWDFSTPRGQRVVRDKEQLPVWVPPDWHYLELAAERGLEPVQLETGSVFPLSDGSRIEVRGDQVGRVNRYGNFRAFRPGTEIIFDGFVFMPPLSSAQRRVPDVLGTHRLILGDGYLIHGTLEEDSIGQGASHGCVRMRNQDVERLYAMIEPGTPVYIY